MEEQRGDRALRQRRERSGSAGDRSDAERFEGILRRLGFKDTVQPGWKQLPGVYHSYGLDPPTGALVHIHAHYQLVVGDDMTKNIHLPVEELLHRLLDAGSRRS